MTDRSNRAVVTVETNRGGALLAHAVRGALQGLPVRVRTVTRTRPAVPRG